MLQVGDYLLAFCALYIGQHSIMTLRPLLTPELFSRSTPEKWSQLNLWVGTTALKFVCFFRVELPAQFYTLLSLVAPVRCFCLASKLLMDMLPKDAIVKFLILRSSQKKQFQGQTFMLFPLYVLLKQMLRFGVIPKLLYIFCKYVDRKVMEEQCLSIFSLPLVSVDAAFHSSPVVCKVHGTNSLIFRPNCTDFSWLQRWWDVAFEIIFSRIGFTISQGVGALFFFLTIAYFELQLLVFVILLTDFCWLKPKQKQFSVQPCFLFSQMMYWYLKTYNIQNDEL